MDRSAVRVPECNVETFYKHAFAERQHLHPIGAASMHTNNGGSRMILVPQERAGNGTDVERSCPTEPIDTLNILWPNRTSQVQGKPSAEQCTRGKRAGAKIHKNAAKADHDPV